MQPTPFRICSHFQAIVDIDVIMRKSAGLSKYELLITWPLVENDFNLYSSDNLPTVTSHFYAVNTPLGWIKSCSCAFLQLYTISPHSWLIPQGRVKITLCYRDLQCRERTTHASHSTGLNTSKLPAPVWMVLTYSF